MNVDYNKHNIVKYLANNKDKDIWKMSVSSIGFQSTKFLDSYPPKGHPFGYTFNPERGRILDEFSLIYITKGRGTFQSGNCSEKKITKGDVFLLFPREWHTYRPAKDIGWNEYFVTFQGEYFNKLLNKIFQPNDPIIHIGINEQIVKHFLEMLDYAKAQSPGFQAVMAGIMMHMIGDIYSINKNYDCEPASLQKIQAACVLILENIYDKLTPEDIAESINMSYSNLRKSFKRYTGITIHQYILQQKISNIKKLLDNTEMSVQDIAMKLNFGSANYFSCFFKSKTGISPLSYRKKFEKLQEKAPKALY